ncbi:hypothetical protein ES703_11030 [subsurface metagenome]
MEANKENIIFISNPIDLKEMRQKLIVAIDNIHCANPNCNQGFVFMGNPYSISLPRTFTCKCGQKYKSGLARFEKSSFHFFIVEKL